MVNNDKPKGGPGQQETNPVDSRGRLRPIRRRPFLKVAGTGAVATSLAGCTFQSDDGGDGGGGGGGGGGGDGDSDGDDGGDGDGGDGGSDIPDTIKIGSMGPSDAPFGVSIHNSVQLAIDEINADGGIGGATVEVITKDTKDNPSTARSGYQELTTGESVNATFGIFGSENLLAVMPNIAQAQTVHMTAGAATPEAPAQVKESYDQFKYWFRVGPVNSVFLGESMIDYAEAKFADMGWETIGVIVEDFKWTEPVQAVLDEKLSGLDVEVVYKNRIAEGTEDFTPIYDELENKGIDGLYTALAHIGTTSLVQWAQQQRPFGYGGIHVPTQLPSFYAATEGAAIATFSQTTATPQSEVTEKTIPYAEAYNEAYDGYPVYNGYSAYDAVYMYKAAVEAAGTVESDAVVSELEGMSYTGTSGQIEFYGEGEEFPHDVKFGPDLAQGIYFQWQADADGNGVQEVLWPDDLATTEYQTPPWA
jgi:branched-chain amino acid transport system substrate-binding protein